MAIISKGITLSYSVNDGDTVVLTNLQEIPELGGDTEAIEITTLADGAHMYTAGIQNYGDSLAFKFLYDETDNQFTQLQSVSHDVSGTTKWIVTLPDNTTCMFTGTCSVKLDGVGVNAALTYTLSVKPSSEMEWSK